MHAKNIATLTMHINLFKSKTCISWCHL